MRGKPYRLHHERDVVPEDGRPRRGIGSLIRLHAGEIHTPAFYSRPERKRGWSPQAIWQLIWQLMTINPYPFYLPPVNQKDDRRWYRAHTH
jgi:hypothetical protein